jgi:hypothetical protein
MDIGQCINDHGSFCLHHSKKYDGKTIDKLTFTVPRNYFKMYLFRFADRVSNEAFYIENCHNQFYKLHIHGEHINPKIPMINSIIQIFRYISQNHVFIEDINRKLLIALKKCANNNSSIEFIRFLNTNKFRLSELELAFDFFGFMPFTKISADALKEYKNSFYSNDYRTYYRKTFNEDDSYGYRKDRTRDSMFIIYDRGVRLGVYEDVQRVEWRLRDERSGRLLEITDLRFSMDDYINCKGYRLKKILNNWVPSNSIEFNWEYINNHFPIFSVLTTG